MTTEHMTDSHRMKETYTKIENDQYVKVGM